MLHRARELLVRQRTMVVNALRGHCAELGLIVAQGASKVEELVAIIEDPGDVRLPPLAREALGSLVEQLCSAQARIKQLEATLLAWHPIQPGEPPACDDPRRRCHHRDGAGRDDRRWRAVSLGPAALGLARSRAPTTLEWRQGQAGADLESAGMAISGACSCMVREACCAGAAPSRARGLAGPTGSWRGGRQTSCWSPWPIRQPASPGHCSDTSVSTDRRPPDQLESGYKLARVTTI